MKGRGGVERGDRRSAGRGMQYKRGKGDMGGCGSGEQDEEGRVGADNKYTSPADKYIMKEHTV